MRLFSVLSVLLIIVHMYSISYLIGDETHHHAYLVIAGNPEEMVARHSWQDQLLNITAALLLNKELSLQQEVLTVVRILTIVKNGSNTRALFSVAIGKPSGMTIRFIVPSEAQVINLTYLNHTLIIIRKELSSSEYSIHFIPLPSDVGIKIYGINEEYFPELPKPEEIRFGFKDYIVKASMSSPNIINGTAYVSGILIVEKKVNQHRIDRAAMQLVPIIVIAVTSLVAYIVIRKYKG